MPNCYICSGPITPQNQSLEHIILNAIGGKLKSKNLICKECNSKLGSEMDAHLAEELNILAGTFMVSRDRGNIPTIKGLKTVKGESYDLVDGIKPVMSSPKFERIEEGENTRIKMAMRSEKEMKARLKDLKKKYPTFDIEEAKKHTQWYRYYMQDPLQISFSTGDSLSARAYCKTATNAYMFFGGERKYIKHLIPYLQGEMDKEDILISYFPDSYEYFNSEVCHLIHLAGNCQENTLYALVDFFSCCCFLIILNEEYDGPNFQKTYCYELSENKEIEKKLSFELTKQKLHSIRNSNSHDSQVEFKKRLARFLSISQKRQINISTKEIIKQAYDKVFKDHPKETPLGEKKLQEFINEVSERYAPFLLHLYGKSDEENRSDIR